MHWSKQFAILIAFASGLFVSSSAGARFRLPPAERFEFCVAGNLSESSMFNEEDRDRINKIVMETAVRMHDLKADPENALNAKTMLRLFAAALACVVSDCDSSVRLRREQACLAVLEGCAESLKEPNGAEVVAEMKKIFLAMNREIRTLDQLSDNSGSAEIKQKERLEKETIEEKEALLAQDIREKKKELSDKSKSEKKEKESEVKERFKRAANFPPFRFPSFSAIDPTLESIIADKLLKSSTFNNFFIYGMSQEDASFFSRGMVETGLSGYRYNVIQEAKNSVTTALSRLGPYAGPNEYAHAIARSISVVLAAHELTFYADGLSIGSSLVYQLDSMLGSDSSSSMLGSDSSSSVAGMNPSSSILGLNPASSILRSNPSSSMLGSNPSSTFALSPSFGSASAASSEWGTSSAFSSSQSSGIAPAQVNPSYVEPSYANPSNPQNGRINPSFVEPSFSLPSPPRNDKSQFQNRLSNLLFGSETISAVFCSGRFPQLFEVINSAFSDYGYAISSTIANVVSNSINMLPTDAACTQYPEVISEIVADILDKNGFILTADPQAITTKISDLINSNSQSNPPQNPPNFGQQTFSGSDYPLNPSFTDYSYSEPEIPVVPVEQNPALAISSSLSDTPLQQQNPDLTNSKDFSYDAAPPVIQSTNKQDVSFPSELSSDGIVSSDESPLSPENSAPGNSKQDFNLPKVISSDGLDSSVGSPLSSDGSIGTNDSWVIVDYPRDVSTALEQKETTSSSTDIAPPIIFGPGPVIPENMPSYIESTPETKVADSTTTTPRLIETTKSAELTTPAPLGTESPSSTVTATPEVITPAPQTSLKDAFESQTQLSEFLMKELESTLKVLNATSSDGKRPLDIPKPSGSSTDVNVPQTADLSPTSDNSKPVENSPDSQNKPSSDQTVTEVQPSMETPSQQNGPSDEDSMNPPEPITDEISALLFAERVSSIVTSSIRVIRSDNFQFDEVCGRLNELAPMVNLPPLDVCSELPLIDYLLHILRASVSMLVGEK